MVAADKPAQAPADRLLWALTGWGGASSEQFDQARDQFFPEGPDAGGWVRARARNALYALAHTDSHPRGARVRALSPRLAELPAAGTPQAVLCGARSPSTYGALEAACAAAGTELRAEPQLNPAAPTRLLVTAGDRDDLAQTARTLGITHQSRPAAYTALTAAPTLAAELAHATWRPHPEPSWPRRDFDAARRSFARAPGAFTGPWRLSEYTNPRDHQRLHLLWRGGMAAEVDRSWGRVAALAAAGLPVFEYDPGTRVATTWATSQLPPPLERILVLCSGTLAEPNLARRVTHPMVPLALAQEVQRRTSMTGGE